VGDRYATGAAGCPPKVTVEVGKNPEPCSLTSVPDGPAMEEANVEIRTVIVTAGLVTPFALAVI